MSEETIELESMEDVYEVMRDNLAAVHNKLLDTAKNVNDDKKPAYEIINDMLEFCNLTYFTLDAMLQIQAGILKNNEIRPGG